MEECQPLDQLRCPCCGGCQPVADTMLPHTEAELKEAYASAGPFNALRPPGWTIEAARAGRLRWACPHCLRTGRALAGDPTSQTWCNHEPYFAFFDARCSCGDCGRSFVFAAAEQRYWYETLKFWVQSWPKQCPPCRRKRRARRRAAREEQARRDGGG